MCTVVNSIERCDRSGLNGMTFWEGSRKRRSECTCYMYRHSISVYAIWDTILRKGKYEVVTFLESSPYFSFAGMKARIDTKVAEEYCWPITQAAERSWCGLSRSSEPEFGFKLDFLVYIYTVEPRLSEIKMAGPTSDNSEIRLDVIRRSKNNVCSETRLMLTKFMAQESVWYLQIQYNTTNFYEKKSDILVWTFFSQRFLAAMSLHSAF